MGEYVWKTFAEINVLATNFGRGIRELGNIPRESVVIFAETREEWMIAAHGLFKQSIPGTLKNNLFFTFQNNNLLSFCSCHNLRYTWR